jgi:hypothetical protein
MARGVGGGCFRVDVHHGDEAENQERSKELNPLPPFLMRQISKWFYDTFIDTATGAARCDSLFRGGFGLLDAS